ncbi:S41 family peptidase [Exiguobacterium oxidotolerans]|uniref:S41 family peptidase n=1 Tax=Exiguobacterium oxidotolerans TaxID=223958 RepID=UPI00049425AA|nr:S41 family peptidase [Exiguobacterium oxidotolerans]
MKKSTTAVIAVSTFGLGLGAGAVGMLATGGTDTVTTSSSGESGDWKKVDQVRQMISQYYLEDVTDQELLEGALSGMTEVLDDPYSVYMDESETASFNTNLSSSFEGIGATLEQKGEAIVIVAPIKGAPAEKAGIKPGDVIVEIDGKSTKGQKTDQAVKKIRGEKGTEVVLTIQRGGQDPMKITIERDTIPIETVYSETEQVNGKTIGVLQVTQFSDPTAEEFEKQLAALEAKNIDGLVIDVRGNPGGLLTAVSKMIAPFIPKDTPIFQVEDNKGDRTQEFGKADAKKPYNIVVLEDSGSASASEILAAGLKEGAGAEVVGTKSFGKGIVQSAYDLKDGSDLKLTTNKWLTPDGNWIHKKGVRPTVEVKQPAYFNVTKILTNDKALNVGDYGKSVENAHLVLEAIGYDPKGQDGYYGDTMKQAVEQLQKDAKLEVTGKIDPVTASEMETRLLKKLEDSKNDVQRIKALEVAAE